MNENDVLVNIDKELERIDEDCNFSSKGHFESAKL